MEETSTLQEGPVITVSHDLVLDKVAKPSFREFLIIQLDEKAFRSSSSNNSHKVEKPVKPKRREEAHELEKQEWAECANEAIEIQDEIVKWEMNSLTLAVSALQRNWIRKMSDCTIVMNT